MGIISDNSIVTIGNKTYGFHNRINSQPELLASFNQLADITFGIGFKSVGGEYEPYVLTDGNTVCANVSVNQVPFYDGGKRKFYIQIGTVMTREMYRKRGLCSWLMETVLNEWKSKCDTIYLFANDSVMEFYPKFGFKIQTEYEYVWNEPSTPKFDCKKISMEEPNNVDFVLKKYGEGNKFSSLSMIDNRAIFDFYATGIFKDNIYYQEKANVIIFTGFEEGKVECYDIFGETNAELSEILQSLKTKADDEVVLGFTPKNYNNLICRECRVEDTTLFVKHCGENRLELNKRMFPIISHA